MDKANKNLSLDVKEKLTLLLRRFELADRINLEEYWNKYFNIYVEENTELGSRLKANGNILHFICENYQVKAVIDYHDLEMTRVHEDNIYAVVKKLSEQLKIEYKL